MSDGLTAVPAALPLEEPPLKRLLRHILSPPPDATPESPRVAIARTIAMTFFLSGAFIKLTAHPVETGFFDDAALPRWMMPLVGMGEIGIALLLASKATSTIGAIVGVAVMVGAFVAVIASGEIILIGLPPITTALLIYVGWSRRAALVAWLGLPPPAGDRRA